MSEEEIGLLRSDIRELAGTIDSLDRAVRGDEDDPGGLLADVRDHEARLTSHDRRAWALAWLGSPLLAALVAVLTWGVAQVWAQYGEHRDELRADTLAIAVIKERVERTDATIEENQNAILRAIRRREEP